MRVAPGPLILEPACNHEIFTQKLPVKLTVIFDIILIAYDVFVICGFNINFIQKVKKQNVFIFFF